MCKINHMIETHLLKNLLGLSFIKYKCNDFVFSNSVYQIVGLFIGNQVLSLKNELEPQEFFGTIEDIAVFKLHSSHEKDIRSGLRDVEMNDNTVNQKIMSIRIVNENKKIYVQSKLKYDIFITKAIIFYLANGEEICFEKDDGIFSEEIIINRGHNLINVITEPNDFYEMIEEEPDLEGEYYREEIILD